MWLVATNVFAFRCAMMMVVMCHNRFTFRFEDNVFLFAFQTVSR